MKRSAVAIILLCFAATALAGVYRWVDANGEVHYSDSPPPKGAKRLSIKTPPTDPAEVAKRDRSRQKKTDDYLQKKQDASAAATRAERKKAQQRKACKQARRRAQKLRSARRVARHLPNGETKYLSGKDLEAYKVKARAQAKRLCGEQP